MMFICIPFDAYNFWHCDTHGFRYVYIMYRQCYTLLAFELGILSLTNSQPFVLYNCNKTAFSQVNRKRKVHFGTVQVNKNTCITSTASFHTHHNIYFEELLLLLPSKDTILALIPHLIRINFSINFIGLKTFHELNPISNETNFFSQLIFQC